MRRPAPLPAAHPETEPEASDPTGTGRRGRVRRDRRRPKTAQLTEPSSVSEPETGLLAGRPNSIDPADPADPGAVTEPVTDSVTDHRPGTQSQAGVASIDDRTYPDAETEDLGGSALAPVAWIDTATPARARTPRRARVRPTDQPAVRLRDVWSAARARRKVLRVEVRRFTGRQRRRRLMWLIVIASVVMPTAITVGAAYSPLLAVQQVTVTGTRQLDAVAVQQALSNQIGTPIALIDDHSVKAALDTFPLVESYTLQARPPHDLVVRIVERDPIGYAPTSAGFDLVDAAGVVLATAPEADPAYPVLDVRGGPGSSAFQAVGEVIRSLPSAIRTQVTAVTATTRDDVTLRLAATDTTVIWGAATDSALKSVVLQTAMVSRPPDGVQVYDVSSPRAIVIQ